MTTHEVYVLTPWAVDHLVGLWAIDVVYAIYPTISWASLDLVMRRKALLDKSQIARLRKLAKNTGWDETVHEFAYARHAE
jgi:hypothetical protein